MKRTRWKPLDPLKGKRVCVVKVFSKMPSRWHVVVRYVVNEWGTSRPMHLSYKADDELGALLAFYKNMKARGAITEAEDEREG